MITPIRVRVRVHVRSRGGVPTASEDYASKALASKLAEVASHVLRATVSLEAVDVGRGKPATTCLVRISLRGRASIVVEERASAAREAIDGAVRGVELAVRGIVEVSEGRARRGRAGGTPVRPPNAPPPDGSLIGRRVGHGKDNYAAALDRPEKRRRDAYVDTAADGTSASDRRAGGGSTARRNTKKRDQDESYALEDSATGRPSRKSTRKSKNRAKPASNLTLRAQRAARAPKARATRAKVRKSRAGGAPPR